MKASLCIIIIFIANICNAQSWSEDFNSITIPNIPSNWTQNNVDGNTVFYNYELLLGIGNNAWVTNDSLPKDLSHGNYLISTSWYMPSGTSNDWIITPTFTVPNNARLKWDASGSSSKESYYVAISTTGTLTSDFNQIIATISAEDFAWQTHDVSLSAFSGQVINIAFVYTSSQKIFLRLDNISVYESAPNDGKIIDVSKMSRYGYGNQIVSGYFKSLGLNPANNATINYSINNGVVNTETINFNQPLNFGDSTAYVFSLPANLALYENTVKVWVTEVNGTPELITTNDTAKFTVFNASQSVLRNAILEEMYSSTCPGSASLNDNFTPIVNANNPNTNGRLNVIKYHCMYGDPSFSNEAIRRTLFYKVYLLPAIYANGTRLLSMYNQSEIDEEINKPAYASITASITINGNVLSTSSDVTPYISIPVNSPLVIHRVLLQKYYNFNTGNFNQNDFYHVMRKMEPDENGISYCPVDGITTNLPFNYTVNLNTPTINQNGYDFWQTTNLEYEYVVFVQDKTTGDILQSASASILDPQYVGLVEFSDNNPQIGIYPNPAADFAVVGLKLAQESEVTISIFDELGKMVYQNKSKQTESGQKEMKINTSNFLSGIYQVSVETNKGLFKDKLIISK